MTEIQKLKIREEVAKGRSRYDVAKDFDITARNVYYHTYDLPRQEHPKITKQMERKM